MGLTRCRLGDLVQRLDLRNEGSVYGLGDVRGVSISKDFIFTKADMSGVNLASYKLVELDTFVYVPVTSRNGDKITIAHNTDEATFIVSGAYEVFRILRNDLLDSGWLFMYFNRPEFDRYTRFHSWGSARETFSWDELCAVELDLPPIEVQRRYAAIYEGLDGNRRDNLRRLRELKLACDAAIEVCKHNAKSWAAIGTLLEEVDVRNTGNTCAVAYGVNINKEFMLSASSSDDLRNYKLVEPGQFVYSSMQTGRDRCIRIALHTGNEVIAVSPAYSVLQARDDTVDSRYLMMWLTRSESDRLGWFKSDGSIRANLDLCRFFEINVPLPDLHTQTSLADMYEARMKCIGINQRLVCLLQNICPVLIKGSIDEARREG